MSAPASREGSGHGIPIDERDHGCVVVRWPSRPVGRAELEAFADDVRGRLLAAPAPVRVLVDVRAAAPLEPGALARLPEIDRRVSDTGKVAARAIVAPGPLAARLVSLAIRAARPTVPTRALATEEAARAWLDRAVPMCA